MRRTPLDNTNTIEKFKLKDGSRVAVIGGGPSGTFFSYFLLDMAARIDLKLHVDIFDSRDFKLDGPRDAICVEESSQSLWPDPSDRRYCPPPHGGSKRH